MSFKNWICSFTEVEHPYSKLARVILGDDNFPEHEDFDAIVEYAEEIDELNTHTLAEAIEEYKKSK